VGASKVPHLDDAIDALSVKLTAEENTFLEELYQPQPVVGPL
jgi:aryl-alcohol dehydrogenase-like predicted oxidoreductase